MEISLRGCLPWAALLLLGLGFGGMWYASNRLSGVMEKSLARYGDPASIDAQMRSPEARPQPPAPKAEAPSAATVAPPTTVSTNANLSPAPTATATPATPGWLATYFPFAKRLFHHVSLMGWHLAFFVGYLLLVVLDLLYLALVVLTLLVIGGLVISLTADILDKLRAPPEDELEGWTAARLSEPPPEMVPDDREEKEATPTMRLEATPPASSPVPLEPIPLQSEPLPSPAEETAAQLDPSPTASPLPGEGLPLAEGPLPLAEDLKTAGETSAPPKENP